MWLDAALLEALLSQLLIRLCVVSERLCGPGSPLGVRAVLGSCDVRASKMAPNPRRVSGLEKVWRRTNSTGRRLGIPEIGAICGDPRGESEYPERIVLFAFCEERRQVWVRYERCHVGSTRMLLECLAARASRGSIGLGYLIFWMQASRRELGSCSRSLGSRGPPAHPTPKPILCVKENIQH